MHNLSLDELFCVMEYLPLHDLSNALLVCKEWHSLDQYEPFWKMILHHHLNGKLILLFDRMASNHLWNIGKVKETLKGNDVKSKYSLLRALKSCKLKETTINYQIDKALMNSVCFSYESHILKDRTASRESLGRFSRLEESELQEVEEVEDRSSMIGKRFKYLMERQLFSNIAITISTFFNSIHYNKQIGFKEFFNVFMNGEVELESKPNEDMYKLRIEVFTLFLKNYQRLDNASKYWEQILNCCLYEMAKQCQVQDCEKLLKKIINSDVVCPLSNTMLGCVFKDFEYYEGILPIITQLFQKMKTYYEMPTFSGNFNFNYRDGISKANDIVKRLRYLENFKSEQEIIEQYMVDLFRICTSLISTDDQNNFIDEILRVYPSMDLLKFPFKEGFFVVDKVIEVANRKGIQYPFESIQQALTEGTSLTDTASIIRYIRDHFKMDIYEIQKRTQFFINFLWQQINSYQTFDHLKEGFNGVFLPSEFPIDLNRLLEVTENPDSIWRRFKSLVNFSFDGTDGLLYLNEIFTPTIFNVETLSACVNNCYDSDIRQVLYNITMFDENEKLSDHVEKMLQEKDWSDFTDTDHGQYPISDPKHLIALYRMCMHDD
ncbi:predicted protein [Naegleria gruberi]|uniref:Predicted protein n=1 Tax=Naegleria gruberi TaxID=5762 RepID=D2W219_NAEGR|nr:uncharacterized protein NAEGRDRAFT_75429 [Naegleria gruberi]EFC36863.1 predicted protein [Naegleria gruberi]|eukprot:XP_002669607.1 predicted protein [Naegleria gruberi strain NEG-M]